MPDIVTRRNFVELLGAAGASALLPVQTSERATADKAVVSVCDFGADRSGVADSIGAVRKAIASLRPEGAVLDFPQGVYRFAPDRPDGMIFRNLRNFEIRGNGSHLIFDGGMRPCAVDGCDGVTIRDLSIDWATLPFSQGTVLGVGERSFTIEIDPGFPVLGHEVIRAIGSYDRATRWPMPNGIDSFNNVSDTQLVGPLTLRVTLKSPSPIEKGSTLVMRHNVYGVTGFHCESSSRIELSNVTFYALPGMGFFASRCNDIKLNQFQTILKPGTDRLMSICADGVHIANCTGAIEIVKCHFQGMGDDAINICSTYTPVGKRLGLRSLLLQNDAGTGVSLGAVPQVGEAAQMCDRKTQALLAEATVTSATIVHSPVPGVQLEFDRDLPPDVGPGSLVCGAQAGTRISIRESSFVGLRARGVLVHKNAEIVDNTFAGCSLAAILMAADTRWLEGPAVGNISITDNTFSNCYYAHPNDRRGTITLDTAHDRSGIATPPVIVNRNVTVTDNVFLRSPGAAIYCAGVDNLRISKNRVGQTDTMESEDLVKGAIVLRNVSKAVLAGNESPVAATIRVLDCRQPVSATGNKNLRLIGNPSA